jgi:hypothetical protein
MSVKRMVASERSDVVTRVPRRRKPTEDGSTKG